MAAVAPESLTFSYFSSLPPELRNKIWLDVLPDRDGPVLYFYRIGCWSPRRLIECDHQYDANDENNLTFEFRHELLDPARVEVPLFFVNHEARDIALAWVCEQGIDMCFDEDGICHMFVRPLDPMRDILYVAHDRWYDFCCEPYDRLFEPDLLGKNVSSGPDLKRIAVPEALLWGRADELSEMFDWFCGIAVLYIIVDPQPDLQLNDEDMVQRRWEVEPAQGRALLWNENYSVFDWDDGRSIGDEALYRDIQEACKGLGKILAKNHIRSFEVRPVHAARR